MKKIFLAAGLCCMSAVPVSAQKDSNHNFEISKNLEIFNDIYKQLDMFYVDSLSADTVIEWGIDAMLRQVGPFTVYYPEEGMDELKEMTTGKYAGIGAVIRFYKKEDRVMVIEPQEDSPAIEAGVKGGDLILSIDGKDMKGKSTQEVSENLRGDAGTTFELTVKWNILCRSRLRAGISRCPPCLITEWWQTVSVIFISNVLLTVVRAMSAGPWSI